MIATILIVDDERNITEVCRRDLDLVGYRVRLEESISKRRKRIKGYTPYAAQ